MVRVLMTGACGSGKTTIIEELDRLGYKTSLKLEKELWFDEGEVKSFEWGIMNNRIEIYKRLGNQGLVFFDRGVIDPIVYRKYKGKRVLKRFDEIARNYKYDAAFVTELLNSHNPNPERDHLVQTEEDAIRWFEIMLETLKEYNYEPIIVKNMSVTERINFILSKVLP